ncbi:NUOA3 [Auxenochlorella protothecoides x Auxenochlorella symbiontica]|uniref:NADH-ubiquinone oxidoreductase 9.5 kDa subunit n=2 Tax=Auxenochlorella protothecoides TaxID=3075 RepID=A0A3M7KZA5_AUXPR|nr:hypothetical protein APUTEX25_005852 [Auxenochlorella protothecoides]|eukprot:RMZ55811.1 hypothetical protein APUTEX25_005852 [Auxenochlorella protothecoides]
MGFLAGLRTAMHQEPIIVWSVIIGGTGVILPLVGPPIREALGYGRSYPAAPPPLKDVLDRNVKTPALDAK